MSLAALPALAVASAELRPEILSAVRFVHSKCVLWPQRLLIQPTVRALKADDVHISRCRANNNVLAERRLLQHWHA